MNLDHLIYFVYVARYLSISRASEILNVDSSTISKAITKLEENIGVSLIVRRGRRLELSRLGKIYYRYATRALAELGKAEEEIKSIANLTQGSLFIGSISSLIPVYLPQLLKQFYRKYPAVHVHLAEYHSSTILELIDNGDLSLGFCGFYNKEEINLKNVDYFKLFQEDFALAVHPNHDFSKRASVSFEDLKHEHVINYETHSDFCEILSEAYLHQTFAENTRSNFYVKDETSILGLVAARIGVAFIPAHLDLSSYQVVKIPLKDLYLSRDIYLIWNSSVLELDVIQKFREVVLSMNRSLVSDLRKNKS
ncbi:MULTISPECIES: LysR family transcriptional regulator [Aerococcus]|uniref:LysR family transcriptional regulator n=1 Tax=Aerococcus TaxID=1375 RepID=UPI000DCDF03A|nr:MULTISPECIES: LysR family transcriptional regulator [Aerococcus]KAA9298062.1 LysR family transcriptional regulator [Aerococcus tenax]MDK6689101.1 LysR family transcriptional regulator [Aerococcus urinae]MDK8133303.1 LysR family transcriptional regulator [Aerococcus urinae]MDK8484818.1 LysR family transcriptional regulator [Aerococcus urinae]MDL5179515.1 LysR family transcriptional regulator [Aerococcus tenax]